VSAGRERCTLLITSSACARGLRVSGAGPDTGVSAGRERCTLLIADSARLRRQGVHRVGRSLDTTPPRRFGPTGQSSWAARRASRRSGTSRPGQSGRRAVAGVWGCGGAVPAGGHRSDGWGTGPGPGDSDDGTTGRAYGDGLRGPRWKLATRMLRGDGQSPIKVCRVYCLAAPALWSRSVLRALGRSRFPPKAQIAATILVGSCSRFHVLLALLCFSPVSCVPC
jgi:hypothetical protein